VDLIAGLPYQTGESWAYSLDQTIAAGVPHVSLYMLEVDEDSRLGRELIAGGTKYHAHHVPDDELTAELYEAGCARLEGAGIAQYEISNFARPGFESRHNLRYWKRQPYLGFGVDAHSMLPARAGAQRGDVESLRLATTDTYDEFLVAPHFSFSAVSEAQALEESFFLGLRMNGGINLEDLRGRYRTKLDPYIEVVDELALAGVLQRRTEVISLTPRGRLVSNEIFEKFLLATA
jgi:oxygen-independent coproporphyrinogen-3 oxidase